MKLWVALGSDCFSKNKFSCQFVEYAANRGRRPHRPNSCATWGATLGQMRCGKIGSSNRKILYRYHWKMRRALTCTKLHLKSIDFNVICPGGSLQDNGVPARYTQHQELCCQCCMTPSLPCKKQAEHLN